MLESGLRRMFYEAVNKYFSILGEVVYVQFLEVIVLYNMDYINVRSLGLY